MTAETDLLIYAFPLTEGTAFHWWYVADGAVFARGVDADPRLAAGLDIIADTAGNPTRELALMSSSRCVVRDHQVDGELTEKQLLSVAASHAKEASLASEQLHVAGLQTSTEQAVTASVSDEIMVRGLAYLQSLGLNPDQILPSGSIIPPSDHAAAADLGFEKVLRNGNAIMPDEPFARDHLIGDALVSELSENEVERALVGAGDLVALNLRSGQFAKKTSRTITSNQRRTILWLLAILLIVSIAIPIVQWIKYEAGANSADASALSAAQPVVGSFDDVELAEQALDEKLVSESRGNVIFSVPASGLFSALQQHPGVTIDTLSYQKDGTVLAGLTALRNEDMNPVLTALQNSGYTVTATPRTDATGKAKANISVRAP